MIFTSYRLRFITPCLCAGGNQESAELRAPSVRGQLRWWFRALGGTSLEERLVFGQEAAAKTGNSSAVQVSIKDVAPGRPWEPPGFSPNDATSYVWYFAKASGSNVKGRPGPRWQQRGAVPGGTAFSLGFLTKRGLGALQQKFDETVGAFLHFGALGLRATRGLGAFVAQNAPLTLVEAKTLLENRGFFVAERQGMIFDTPAEALADWSAWLRYRLRDRTKAKTPSPLGSSDPARQASAIRFRPIELADRRYSWLALEAPHHRVLGESSCRPKPLLENLSLVGDRPNPRSL